MSSSFMEQIAELEKQRESDHGNSPAQLREKVEALEQVVVDCIKRIEELEKWSQTLKAKP